MSRSSAAILAILAALAFAAVAFASDDSSADESTAYTVVGLVNDYEGNGLFGVDVSIVDTAGAHTGYTDSDGKFTITGVAETSEITITFMIEGKTVSAVSSTIMTAIPNSNSYKLTLPLAALTETTYDISSYPVTMMETYLTAYLMEDTSSGNVPLANASVIIMDNYKHVSTVTTDEDGKFTAAIGSTYGLRVAVEKDGYTVVSQFFIKILADSDYTWGRIYLTGSDSSINLSYNMMTPTDADGIRTYSIPATYPILVALSTGTVSMFVYDANDRPLQGATVTLTLISDKSQKYAADTDKNGYVSISNVSTGEYNMSVQVGGFETVTTDSVNITRGNNILPDTVMTEKSEFNIFGVNIGHLMMLFGMLFGLILVVLSVFLYSRRNKGLKIEE